MRIVEGLGHAADDGGDLLHGQQGVRLGERGQIFSRQILHGDIRQVMFFTSIVDDDDVGMIVAAGGFRFAEKTCLHAGEFITSRKVGSTAPALPRSLSKS